MAVYTSLSLAQVKQLLAPYELDTTISYAGIADGIENTNYHVKTSIGNYVVTIFEHYIPNQLENAGSNTWKLSLIRESNDFPMLG
ncbi:MAG: hypothetical protein LC437_04015, partial [Thiohalomonas sp.]|nr:hypothetical protein [Thiohalomonas sp.]